MSARLAALALGASLLAVAAPLPAQTVDVAKTLAELKADNARMAQRIADLETQIARGAAAPAVPVATAAPAPARVIQAAAPPPAKPEMPASGSREASYAPKVQVPFGTLDRPVQPDGAGVELSASSSGEQVAIVVGQTVASTRVDLAKVEGTATSWSVTAAASPDKSGKDTMLATLDAFTSGSSLKFRIGQFHLTMPNLLTNARYLALEEIAEKHCIAEAKGDKDALAVCDGGINTA